ncbi:MAG: vitamin B12-dependent ribonucleotide reductase, partial [Clostridiaceae bacterium]|nr:vitamin B12-dependent ribonucleotide reductase [Clostridiaceae bacterium]
MKLSENAVKVLEKRYLAKDEKGNLLETPELMFRRVAKTVAMADKDYVDEDGLKEIEERFYNLMTQLYFLPNSPTLMNAGRPLGQLSACFVLPIEDSMEGIFDSVKNAALIHKSGGGTGFSFSRLRAKGASVNSTGGVASGPVSFMKVFNAATEAVKQGGTRRGANMGILRIDHPDILEFITCKQNNADITNFNISVGITEAFMEAVELGKDYDLIEPKTNKKTGSLNAREVFNMMVEMAWKNGEPGIIFLDRLNRDNVTPQLGEIESTNPCGEQPLLPYEACNLGSINLSLLVKKTENGAEIDYDKLKEIVHEAVHFLDNVIDVNQYPLPEIDKMTRGTRKIGLGVMGWADMLLQLGVAYDSDKANTLAEEVMGFIRREAQAKSMELAKVKGVFPYYDQSIFKKQKIKIRNATTTTIAPTGTLSIIAGVSSGVEPLFAISFIKNVMDNDELVETNPIFKAIALERGFYSEELMKQIAKKGGLHDMEEVPQDIRELFVTAHDITPEWHVKMQASFQKHTDNAVSKTVNLRNEATTDDVREVFISAFKTGCKGVTIYRDGSRDMQVLNIGKVNNKEEESKQAGKLKGKYKIVPRPRPDITNGFTEKVRTGCGNLYITVNYDENG